MSSALFYISTTLPIFSLTWFTPTMGAGVMPCAGLVLGVVVSALLTGSAQAAGNAKVFDIGSDVRPFEYTVVSVDLYGESGARGGGRAEIYSDGEGVAEVW